MSPCYLTVVSGKVGHIELFYDKYLIGNIEEALDVLNYVADSHISLWLQRRALQKFGQQLKANNQVS